MNNQSQDRCFVNHVLQLFLNFFSTSITVYVIIFTYFYESTETVVKRIYVLMFVWYSFWYTVHLSCTVIFSALYSFHSFVLEVVAQCCSRCNTLAQCYDALSTCYKKFDSYDCYQTSVTSSCCLMCSHSRKVSNQLEKLLTC